MILFIVREREGREKERERNIDVQEKHQLSSACPQLGTWPATEARAGTGNQTGKFSVCRMTPNPLSHTSQGLLLTFKRSTFYFYFFIKKILFSFREEGREKERERNIDV